MSAFHAMNESNGQTGQNAKPTPDSQNSESYVTFQANPAQAKQLLELGAITETHYRQAQAAGGLLVSLPAPLVESFQQDQRSTGQDVQAATQSQTPGFLTPYNEEQELDKMAHWLDKAGMNAFARLFLVANRPLSFIGSQFLLAVQPLTKLVLRANDPTGNLSILLEKRENIDRIVSKLETLEAQPKNQPKRKKL